MCMDVWPINYSDSDSDHKTIHCDLFFWYNKVYRWVPNIYRILRIYTFVYTCSCSICQVIHEVKLSPILDAQWASVKILEFLDLSGPHDPGTNYEVCSWNLLKSLPPFWCQQAVAVVYTPKYFNFFPFLLTSSESPSCPHSTPRGRSLCNITRDICI